MIRINSLIKNAIGYYRKSSTITKASLCFILVTVIDNGITLITQPIINRILSTAEVGLYGSFNSWESIIRVIASFYLYCGVLEVLITKEKEDKNQAIGSLCVLSLLITLLCFGVIFLLIRPATEIMGLKPIYILVMGVTIAAGSVNEFWFVPKRFEYAYKPYAILGVSLFFVKSVLSIILAYVLEDRVLGRMLGLCIPSLIAAIVLLIYILKRTEFSCVTKYWKRAILFNLPLIPHYLSSVLLSSSDRIMIQHLDGSSNAGLYTVAYSFASLTLVVFSAVNSAYTPFAYGAIRDQKYEELSKRTNSMMAFSVLFALCLVLLAPEGLYILGGSNYLAALDIIPVLIVGIFFSSFYFIFSNVEYIYEKTTYVFPITLIGAGVNILLNWLLIPSIGFKAAAYTTLIGYVVIAAAHYAVSLFILKKNIYSMPTVLALLTLLMGVSALALLLYKVHFLIRYLFIVLLLAALLLMILKKKDLFVKKDKN